MLLQVDPINVDERFHQLHIGTRSEKGLEMNGNEIAGSTIAVPPGLSGVVVADTSVGDLRPEKGYYTYRQYSALELARHSTFETAWHLVAIGRFPDAAELAEFATTVTPMRRVAVNELSSYSDPLLSLAAGLAMVGDRDGIPALYDGAERRLQDALRLCSAAPTLVAAAERARLGLPFVEPSAELGHVANYLYMLRGAPAPEEEVCALSAYLITAIDHGFNASTFATRVVASTGASITVSLLAGLAALSGPLHGGAPSRVLDALDEIGTEENIADWVASTLRQGKRIMGFGHAVYRGPDPRAELMREKALSLGGPRAHLAAAFEREVVRQLEVAKPGRRLPVNLELYAAIVMEQCGVPRHLFTATFAIARMVGWAAHALEQADQNKIIRPSSRYIGPSLSPLPAEREAACPP